VELNQVGLGWLAAARRVRVGQGAFRRFGRRAGEQYAGFYGSGRAAAMDWSTQGVAGPSCLESQVRHIYTPNQETEAQDPPRDSEAMPPPSSTRPRLCHLPCISVD